jgi:hypothetical protein
MRLPSSMWIWRKATEWFSVAFTSLIGMLIRPKETAPFQIDLTFDTLQVAFAFRPLPHDRARFI